jgi:hypothetical protein
MSSSENGSSTALATPDQPGGLVLPAEVGGRLRELLEASPREDGAGIASLLAAIMDAPDLDAAAAVLGGLDSTADMVGIKLIVEGFMLRESDYGGPDDPVSAYATVYAHAAQTDHTGQVNRSLSFNSGSLQVLALLATAHSRGWFPFAAHVEAKQIKRTGRTAYNLVVD